MQYQDSRGRPLKPCRGCGGPKPPGKGHGYCEACKAARNPPTPCLACGGPKSHGKHRLCDACAATADDRRRAHSRAKARQWAQDNPERNAARAKAWREANPERTRSVIKAWEEAHADTVREAARRASKRRQMRKVRAYVHDVDSLVVLERDDGICGICGGDVDPMNFHVDHIVPIARGGEHAYYNVQAAHPRCNWQKHVRLPHELAA